MLLCWTILQIYPWRSSISLDISGTLDSMTIAWVLDLKWATRHWVPRPAELAKVQEIKSNHRLVTSRAGNRICFCFFVFLHYHELFANLYNIIQYPWIHRLLRCRLRDIWKSGDTGFSHSKWQGHWTAASPGKERKNMERQIHFAFILPPSPPSLTSPRPEGLSQIDFSLLYGRVNCTLTMYPSNKHVCLISGLFNHLNISSPSV